MGEFSPPFSEPPSFFFFSYPSNIKIIFDFSDIITKIHRPFQNPGSALEMMKDEREVSKTEIKSLRNQPVELVAKEEV